MEYCTVFTLFIACVLLCVPPCLFADDKQREVLMSDKIGASDHLLHLFVSVVTRAARGISEGNV